MTEGLSGDAWRWNPLALAPLSTFVVGVAMAAFIWSRKFVGRRREATFAPVAFGVALWSLGVAIATCTRSEAFALWLARFVVSMIVVIGPLALSFVTAFARVKRRPWIVGVAAAGAAIGVGMVWLDPGVVPRVRQPIWGGWYPVGGPRFWIYPVAFTIGCMTVAQLIAVRAWLHTPPSRRRRQAGYVALSYVAAILGGVDALGATGRDIPPLAWAPSLVSILLVYYAIVRWRLMDVRTAFHRTLPLLLVAATTFAPVYGFARATAGWPGWRETVPRAVLVVVILVVLRLYAALVDRLLADLLGRRRRAGAAVVERFSARALEARRPAELVPPLAEALGALGGLELRAVAIRVDAGEGSDVGVTVLPAGAPAAPFDCAAELPAEPLARSEADPDEPEPRERAALRWLAVYDADVLLPMRHAGAVVGAIVARAPKGRRAPPGLDEVGRHNLDRLGSRAAVVLTNAILHEALEQRSTGLEVEVKERTRALAGAIDDLKAAQASLVQAEKQSSLGLLVAGVSHEINNALNFIFGNLPMLAKYARTYEDLFARCAAAGATLPARVAAGVAEARASIDPTIVATERAAGLARSIVDDLRRFARHDEAERKIADVREGLESTINLLRAELRGRVAIEQHAAPDLPHIECYPAALNHVFLNVLLNAAQAIVGQGTITVTLRHDAGRVTIEIADDGRGLPEAVRDRAFEPFVTTRPKAAGLGLAVSRQIIDRHGGAIRIDPNPAGRGTVVTITLPASRV